MKDERGWANALLLLITWQQGSACASYPEHWSPLFVNITCRLVSTNKVSSRARLVFLLRSFVRALHSCFEPPGVPLAAVRVRGGPRPEGQAEGGSQDEVSCALQVKTKRTAFAKNEEFLPLYRP